MWVDVSGLVDRCHAFHALVEGFLVEWDQVVMAFGQGFAQGFYHILQCHYGDYFQQRTQHNHIECLHIVHLGSHVHGIDAVDVYVGSDGWSADSVRIIDKCAVGLDTMFKALQRGLVEDDGRVEGAHYGR